MTAEKSSKKMEEVLTHAEGLVKDIEKTVADELQISLPVVPQDPSDRFNAWLGVRWPMGLPDG
jgi:hypothetical protein